jgi:hypothetical protein
MSSFLTRVIWEAERESVVEFIQALRHDEGLRAVMREKGLQAAMPRSITKIHGIVNEPDRPMGRHGRGLSTLNSDVLIRSDQIRLRVVAPQNPALHANQAKHIELDAFGPSQERRCIYTPTQLRPAMML